MGIDKAYYSYKSRYKKYRKIYNSSNLLYRSKLDPFRLSKGNLSLLISSIYNKGSNANSIKNNGVFIRGALITKDSLLFIKDAML